MHQLDRGGEFLQRNPSAIPFTHEIKQKMKRYYSFLVAYKDNSFLLRDVIFLLSISPLGLNWDRVRMWTSVNRTEGETDAYIFIIVLQLFTDTVFEEMKAWTHINLGERYCNYSCNDSWSIERTSINIKNTWHSFYVISCIYEDAWAHSCICSLTRQ